MKVWGAETVSSKSFGAKSQTKRKWRYWNLKIETSSHLPQTDSTSVAIFVLPCGQNIKKKTWVWPFPIKTKITQAPSHAISIQIHTVGSIKQQKNARLQHIEILAGSFNKEFQSGILSNRLKALKNSTDFRSIYVVTGPKIIRKAKGSAQSNTGSICKQRITDYQQGKRNHKVTADPFETFQNLCSRKNWNTNERDNLQWAASGGAEFRWGDGDGFRRRQRKFQWWRLRVAVAPLFLAQFLFLYTSLKLSLPRTPAALSLFHFPSVSFQTSLSFPFGRHFCFLSSVFPLGQKPP